MTSCARVRERLPGYHLVTLEAEDRSEVEQHLGSCLACVRELVAWKRAFEVDEGPVPPPRLRARVRAAVLAECAPRFGHRARWEQPLALAVACGLIVVAESLTTLLTGGEGAPPRGLGRAAALSSADGQRLEGEVSRGSESIRAIPLRREARARGRQEGRSIASPSSCE
ncbi:MAG: hypothetical protein U0183_23015 [Polyangiaceae bacterium]